MTITALLHFLAADWMENLAVLATVAGIWLTARRRLLGWPITLLADVLYLYVFFNARLYSDSLLQIFFIAFTLYGWFYWWRGIRSDGAVLVENVASGTLLCHLAAGLAGALLLGIVMYRLGAALPFLDASLTAFSLVASWWQARKYIANWWLWIVVDAIYVGEYLYKGLRPTALLYAGLVVLAFVGLKDWKSASQKALASASGA